MDSLIRKLKPFISVEIWNIFMEFESQR